MLKSLYLISNIFRPTDQNPTIKILLSFNNYKFLKTEKINKKFLFTKIFSFEFKLNMSNL